VTPKDKCSINYEVKKVDSFKYLQVKIATNRNIQEEITHENAVKLQNWRHIWALENAQGGEKYAYLKATTCPY
jgi:hypothetical protein